MTYQITQPLIEKAFFKLGQMARADLDLESEEAQVDFMKGFVNSLQKVAGMTPQHALGFIKYLTEVGYQARLEDKLASEDQGKELDELFLDMNEKVAYWITDPRRYAEPLVKAHGEASGRAAADRMGEHITKGIGDITNQIGDFAGKAWGTVSNPEFLKSVAPWAIGALGGYLIPKMLGGGNGLANAAIGAGVVGGGKILMDKYKLNDPDTWNKWKDSVMSPAKKI
jgi:hypothetical protein